MAFLSVNEIGELIRVPYEEYRRVVAHQVPVALLCIKFDREATHVTLRISSAELTGHGRKTHDQRRPATGLQYFRLRVLRDVTRDRQRAVRTPTLGVDRTFGNSLAVLVRELLNQLIILQQQRT